MTTLLRRVREQPLDTNRIRSAGEESSLETRCLTIVVLARCGSSEQLYLGVEAVNSSPVDLGASGLVSAPNAAIDGWW